MKTRLTIAAQGADFEHGRLRALISAETVDRSSERLLASGVELDNYLRNPVLLWAHDAALPPIGRAVQIEPEPGVGVWAVNEFAPTPFAQEIAGLYRDRFLNAFSVGFRPLELDSRQRVAGQHGATILRWELVEQSAVAVPANPDALVTAAADGNRAADWLLKTYYPAADDATVLRRLGLGDAPGWDDVAVAACRYFRGGADLPESQQERAEGLLRRMYEAHGRDFPEPEGDAVQFRSDEPTIFEEREFAALASTLRGRSEALRNLARSRRRRGRPLPVLDGVTTAAAHLAEVLDAGDAVVVEQGAVDALSELQTLLLQLRDERAAAVHAALDILQRGGAAPGSRPA